MTSILTYVTPMSLCDEKIVTNDEKRVWCRFHMIFNGKPENRSLTDLGRTQRALERPKRANTFCPEDCSFTTLVYRLQWFIYL